MATRDEALVALSKNAPIDWLFGRVLRSLAARGHSHLLFELLAGKNPHLLEQWNARIAEFHSVVLNPDIAAKRADKELSTSLPERIGDFMAEVYAVIILSRDGYTNFEAVLAVGDQAAVDFTALKAGQRVRIEVKHLREPDDIIRTVVAEHWKRCRTKNPDRFNFKMRVSHHHHAPLSKAAIARLKNAIDLLPDIAADRYPVTLEGGVDVVLTRTVTDANKGGWDIETGYGSGDFEFDLPELQNLFIKAFRDVCASLGKFFGRKADPHAMNLIAMQWETPKFHYDATTPEKVQRAIEQAFAAVDLQLSILIFVAPPTHDPRFRST